MEPDRQIEIQLGHMCNNRCVFCVSGQRTADGDAGPLPADPTIARIRQAAEAGHTKITLLGGEPTLQPQFLEILRETVRLGFEEIVLFTNGAKTARAAYVDEILATGGNFTWRISIQGATRESHDRTTRKRGAFDRIVRTLGHLRDRDQRVTVNLCLVGDNHADVEHFGPLVREHAITQLHLDLMRPLDAGRRTDEELRDCMPSHATLVPPLRRMVAALPDDFDVNIGNLPYCAAPDLAPWIHHDGEPTETIAVDGDGALSRPWNKYLVKARDKVKTPKCRECLFDSRCSGVFETYVRFHGLGAIAPVDANQARAADAGGRLVGLWAPTLVTEAALEPAAPRSVEARSLGEDRCELRCGAHRLTLRPAHLTAGALALHPQFTVHGAAPADDASARAFTSALAPLGPLLTPIGPAAAHPRLEAALVRVREAAPLGDARWSATRLKGDSRAELVLIAADGAKAVVWIALDDGRATGGYRLEGEASPALVEGLRTALLALRGARAVQSHAPSHAASRT